MIVRKASTWSALWPLFLAGSVLGGCGEGSPVEDRPIGQTSGKAFDDTDIATAAFQRRPPGNAKTSDRLAFGIRPYPNATQIGDTPDLIAAAEGRTLRWLQYETTMPPGSVIAFYKGQAVAAGLNIQTDEAKPLTRSMLLETASPDGRVLNVSTLEQAGGRTFIDLRIGTLG